ncbi:hypothetical protein KIH87_00450 [Paraneptunicella aestuarii]|uniref:hypothetical protein n=1 Tax=Paraneptunicella aestuarii TaxID=2831148 RepID=UPI001E5A2569|nr:hypothetical protein [Paraneptunicella aestuarii]UAA38883.1 hypothetical protein KIH87_00450 [Paraneptunicella aestuarii]
MLKQLINKLAQSPDVSWKRFKIGLVCFALSVVLILVGAQSFVLLQIPGLILLVIGLLIAARGYIGIVCYRLSQFKPPKPPPGL